MRISHCRFVTSAFREADEPNDPGPDVVFLGRSNVGKSALINRLLGVKGLARTSSTPGRTQSVNFYRVNEALHFVDLPGYGYARVPEAVRRSWGPMIEGFLERRSPRIALGVLVVDARHAPTRQDRQMRDWLADRGLDHVVAATKADKLSGNGRQQAMKVLREALGAGPRGEPLLVSSKTGLGLRELWRHLDDALAASRHETGA